MRETVGRVTHLLRTETVGGVLLVAAAAVAVLWANSPWRESYRAVREFRFGPAGLGLELSVATWAADGLLAVFFFVVGVELKHEFVAGELRNPRKAMVPVAASLGGVAFPALIYTAVNWGRPTVVGWAIPAATDIAFALAVLAIISSHLPTALRVFLLTLAVVDDLVAIVIIAVVYTSEIHVVPLLGAVVVLAGFWFLVHRWPGWFAERVWRLWVYLLPLGVVTWALVHASGLHATLAGVALGMMIPIASADDGEPGLRPEDDEMAEHATGDQPLLEDVVEHSLRPLSAGFVVPVFALFAAGVTIPLSGFAEAMTSPVVLGIGAGLLLGKPLGILTTTLVMTKITTGHIDESIDWIDLVGVGLLGGIGFTVSLLISELSFAGDPLLADAKIGVLAGTICSALFATVLLAVRDRHHRELVA